MPKSLCVGLDVRKDSITVAIAGDISRFRHNGRIGEAFVHYVIALISLAIESAVVIQVHAPLWADSPL
jgi:hypothetical protein